MTFIHPPPPQKKKKKKILMKYLHWVKSYQDKNISISVICRPNEWMNSIYGPFQIDYYDVLSS